MIGRQKHLLHEKSHNKPRGETVAGPLSQKADEVVNNTGCGF